MFFFCLSINDKRTKEQNSVAFQSILLQNWNSGGDSLEKFPFKAHSHSAKLPLNSFNLQKFSQYIYQATTPTKKF